MSDRPLSRSFSLYLDLLRLLAALAVMVSHTLGFSFGNPAPLPTSLGHNAVIVFFLLSGYVIAYVVDHKEDGPRAFWISRLARIYSVAIPAIVLTPLIDSVGLKLDPAFYALGLTTHDYAAVRILASLGFVNELWLVSIMPFSNSPYWSLCYEMAYYLLFSIFCFTTGRKRWLWLGLAALVIGPKILLLSPIWVLGVVLYRKRAWYAISMHTGWALWLVSLAGIAAFQYYDVSKIVSSWTDAQLGRRLYTLLHFSKHFLADYPLAVLMAMNFVGFRRIAEQFAGAFALSAAAIRMASSFTFSVYLFHLPLVLLFSILLQGMGRGMAYFLATLGCTLAVVLPLGAVTERQKDRLKFWLSRRLPSVGLLARAS
jgi:peptidoglycan/LPS O-acetylase OafA/YrhL